MNFDSKIIPLAESLIGKTITRRRDLHRHPETAWTEFRTASIVADILKSLNYEVLTGEAVVAAEAMMGVPDAKILERHMERAIEQGANPEWVKKMRGGKTGVVGILRFDRPGPTVGLRFDLDANDADEAQDEKHRPCREKFISVNKGAMHACGHDGHTSVGLAVAEILASLKDELCGTVKLIFQPAEEGVRGARAMVEKGVADDVDFMLGAHFGFKMAKTGQVTCNVTGFLATSKLDAQFTGIPAHAGAAPEAGRNALLAAATAAVQLHAIPRHSEGVSRINVGTLHAGTGRNVIAPLALIKLETRGSTSGINRYMAGEAVRIIKSSAAMYDVKVELTETGGAAGGNNSPELAEKLYQIVDRLGIFREVAGTCDFGASEDFSYFMERVQERGGQAAYMMIGADLAAGHHDSYFDFDEQALDLATKLISAAAAGLLCGE